VRQGGRRVMGVVPRVSIRDSCLFIISGLIRIE
jgi:hypothetical protein